jgi:hypothetical protein
VSQPADGSDLLHVEVLDASPITWEVTMGSVSATNWPGPWPSGGYLPGHYGQFLGD